MLKTNLVQETPPPLQWVHRYLALTVILNSVCVGSPLPEVPSTIMILQNQVPGRGLYLFFKAAARTLSAFDSFIHVLSEQRCRISTDETVM